MQKAAVQRAKAAHEARWLVNGQKLSPAGRRRGPNQLFSINADGTGFSVYGATKAAIRNFARQWILDLKSGEFGSTPSVSAPRRRRDSWP
jgi:NAD(P)-dependent dehydrogenase (short-subunit alcohol dehydrogenase family)